MTYECRLKMQNLPIENNRACDETAESILFFLTQTKGSTRNGALLLNAFTNFLEYFKN